MKTNERRPKGSRVIELAVFRLRPGVAEYDFSGALTASNAWLSRQPGFLLRRHGVSDSGERVDYLEWESVAAAQSAAEAFVHAIELRPFNEAIDMESMSMRHFALVI